MYAQAVVLTYQPPEIDSYTYKVPKSLEKEIKVGQLVEIPFGKRNPTGLIIAISHSQLAISQKVEIREISKIVFTQPVLLPYQLELLQWMSFYYTAPMANCLGAMLPEVPSAKHLGSHSQLAISHSNRSTNAQSPKPNDTTLVLTPSINRLPQTMAQFKRAKNYVIYHAELKKNERFTAWIKILSGNADYVFGSRSAIFAPCPKLAKIIIFDEHDGAYKDERSPYFDALTVAEKMSDLTGTKIEIIDPAPKIKTYFEHKNDLQISKYNIRSEIVSMTDERRAGNKGAISEKLAFYLRYAKKKNKKVLLFLNKKKESGYLFCRSCKQSTFVPKRPQECPHCKSPDFYFSSLNIFSLKDEVKKISSNGKNIDIETAGALYKPTLYKYDLLAHIFVDSLIGIPDFASEEKLFSQITDLKSLLAPTGLLLIQTYNPQNSTLTAAANGDFKNYFDTQIDLRKKLSYPPFALLAKLSLRGKNEEKVEKEAGVLSQKLNESIVSSQMSIVSVLGPFKPIFWSKIPSYNIIAKYKLTNCDLASREKAIENLKDIFKIVPRNWQITVEPPTLN